MTPGEAVGQPAPARFAAGGEPMCSAAELSSLFLFEQLSDDQLGWLCQEGRVTVAGPGLVYAEGDPAESLFVLLAGTVVLYRQIGDDEVEVTRTSQPGVYGGAFFAYLGDRVPQVYNNSMRVTERSRFFVLEAAKFAQLMTEWFPMAVHLLEGLMFGTKNAAEAVGQRERLLALGSLSAGLAHELNNPAAAAVRAAGSLRDAIAALRGGLGRLAAELPGGSVLSTLIGLQAEAAERVAAAPAVNPVEAADREDAIAGWLDARDVPGSWDLAPALVQAGLDAAWLDRLALAAEAAGGPDAVRDTATLVGRAVEAELLITEITDSVSRISALVSATRQYSQLDRAPYQVADVHDLLDSTLAMLGSHIGPGITVVRDYDRSLPPVAGYPAELNQVWTNLIDNAVYAMNGAGTLTIRTAADRDQLLVEVADTGPGIPAELQQRIFEPFVTTKPVGQGTGLGLDISWRIVVRRHHGDLRVESLPGNTRFQVRLPLSAQADRAQAAG